jgi:uncharacterized integral membrane protein
VKILYRIVGVILFVIFFGFALKNTQEAGLYFFWGYEVHGPLVLLLFGFFAIGVALGILFMTPMAFRYRRELSRHKAAIESMKKEKDVRQQGRIPPGAVLSE